MKHKVWSKKFNCWMDKGFFDKHYESGMVPDTFINSEGILVFVYSGFSTHVVDPDEYVIVWSTGLRDRNGKEIYEGDIIRIENHPFEGPMQINGNYEVGYNERMELCCGSWLLHRMLPYITVIGNIYENPNLLEVPHG